MLDRGRRLKGLLAWRGLFLQRFADTGRSVHYREQFRAGDMSESINS